LPENSQHHFCISIILSLAENAKTECHHHCSENTAPLTWKHGSRQTINAAAETMEAKTLILERERVSTPRVILSLHSQRVKSGQAFKSWSNSQL